MKNITNKSIEEDYNLVKDMFHKYSEAIYENQEAQKAHYDNQSKLVRLAMADVRTGVSVALTALKMLNSLGVIEDEPI